MGGTTPLFGSAVANVGQGQTAIVALDEATDACLVTAAEPLLGAVNCCKQQLGLTGVPLPPAGSCVGPNTVWTHTASLSDPGKPDDGDFLTNRLGYFKVNDDVDAVFHCEQLDETKGSRTGTLEMSIHNRKLGTTCFMGGLGNGSPSPIAFPSLEDVYSTDQATRSTVNSFWRSNEQSGTDISCTDCHRFGSAYIVENKVVFSAPPGGTDDRQETVTAMEHFGLLNNGHDMKMTRYAFAESDPTAPNSVTSQMRGTPAADVGGTCVNCHTFFQAPAQVGAINGIPQEMSDNQLMPPTQSDSDYRWMNHNPPSATGESELLADEQADYNPLWSTCQNPVRTEAHVVGNQMVFRSDEVPNRLSKFNVRDGLECLNSAQPAGQPCLDYAVRYLCVYPHVNGDPLETPNTNAAWTPYFNNPIASDGDHELRATPSDLCTASGPGEVYAMDFKATDSTGKVWTGNAPNDQLSVFDTTGLVCLNSQQTGGNTCSNYVVRFVCSP
jgi:hypothetical protein